MATVLIESQPFNTYATIEEADLYMLAAVQGATWRAADEEDKARALITATRILDRQRWKGTKTDAAQALAWPRTNTGVLDVEDDEIPQAIVDASIEMALALVEGSELQNEQNASQKIQSIGAGSVNISYFRGAEGVPTRFPTIINELLRDYLAMGGSLDGFGIFTSGTDGKSISDRDYGLSDAY